MNSQELVKQPIKDSGEEEHGSHIAEPPSINNPSPLSRLSPFWHDHLIELGLIVSLVLYYIIGNNNLGSGGLFHLNPLLSLPFLLIFAALTWYRLPFAVALIPLALPYYLQQKPVYSHYEFSLAEIALVVCLGVALLQWAIQRERWPYSLSFAELRNRFGPFTFPILIFVLASIISIFIAYERQFALRAFRQEVIEPVLYLLLAFYCLRTREDMTRLLLALLASAYIVALIGMAQYFLFRDQLVLEADGVRRVHAMYGSANNIGLFFDYSVPIGLAFLFGRARQLFSGKAAWKWILATVVIGLPLLLILYLTQSRGAWVAIALAALFVLALSIHNRKVLLGGGLALLVAGGGVLFALRHPLINFFLGGHQSVVGVSTLTKRLYLWESALRMIHDRPWFGFGLDNWLCYYSQNSVCNIPALYHHHYWVLYVPGTNILTGLSDEPTLSHPHNIFLHVWVSIGIFGLLAFVALLILFYWLFTRILKNLRKREDEQSKQLQWMTIGTGAALLAGLIQGQVDNAFLAQDLAFCFWMLVTSLLLLRVLSGTSWRDKSPSQAIEET